jgi:hypothetical protein
MQQGLTVVFGRARGGGLRARAGNELVLDDGSIRSNVGQLAVLQNHLWVTEHGRFSRFDIEQPVVVRFAADAAQSRSYGPYRHLSGVDGVIYAEQRVFAFYDEQQQDWYAFEDARHWPRIVIVPAANAP